MTAARRLAAILVGGYKLGLGAIERPAPSRLRAELRSTGIISAGLEVIDAFRRFEDVGAGVEGDQQARDGSFGDLRRKAFSLE